MQLSPDTNSIERLADQLPIVSVYVGYKTPTPVVIERVQQQWSAENPLWHWWLDCVDDITQQAKQALQGNDLVQLGLCMNMAQGLMQGLGVSNTDLDTLVHQLRAADGLLGAKISGSGLGDCVVALGVPMQPIPNALPVVITPQAAYWHSHKEAQSS
jgi:mevalonate kinase